MSRRRSVRPRFTVEIMEPRIALNAGAVNRPVPGSEADSVAPAARNSSVFVANLSGQNIVPPLKIPTNARGSIRFQLNRNGQTFNVTGTLTNISNVSVIDLHLTGGPVDSTVELLLKPAKAIPIARSTFKTDIKAPYLMGPLVGHPLSDLTKAMQDGKVYVLVQTSSSGLNTTPQPGNYPAGEIKGPVVPVA